LVSGFRFRFFIVFLYPRPKDSIAYVVFSGIAISYEMIDNINVLSIIVVVK